MVNIPRFIDIPFREFVVLAEPARIERFRLRISQPPKRRSSRRYSKRCTAN